MSKIGQYIKKEFAIHPTLKAGYSRSAAIKWYNKCNNDESTFNCNPDKKSFKAAHKAGFLIASAEHYSIEDFHDTDYISDRDYASLQPFNNLFTKWIEDIYTSSRILRDHQDVMRKIYFSIFPRDDELIILPAGGTDRKYTAADVIDLIKEKGALELRPAFWSSQYERFLINYDGSLFSVNGEPIQDNRISEIIDSLNVNYIVADPVSIFFKEIDQIRYDHFIKFWIANDYQSKPVILSSELTLLWMEEERKSTSIMIDVNNGAYHFHDREYVIDNWSAIVRKIEDISKSIRQINFFTMNIALDENGFFKIVYLDGYPSRPSVPYNPELNTYLKSKVQIGKYSTIEYTKDLAKKFTGKVKQKLVMLNARPGIRPYMQSLWTKAAIDDLLHTKGATLSQKLWLQKHGFYSFRMWQYGITKENYKEFVSDYDYMWLNRINNNYQKWVNDKTTFRMIMEPLKKYAPKYYFLIFHIKGEAIISRQYDLPSGISEDLSGVLQLLKEKQKLVFKPSGGTHGDGFYCIEYRDGSYWANGEPKTEEEFCKLLLNRSSFYVITEYINMHSDLKKIYDKSVNTVRVVVVNRHGYDPKIMQQYIRIGSLRTGYTDNVAYGGVCAMIDNNTGEIYAPEVLKDHRYYACPKHPDTGTEISGKVPNWELVCDGVLEISRYLGELEYLGYDVAITDDGFRILEINIHSDLHKVAKYNDDFKEFFAHKIEMKAKKNNITLD